ncbi:hypothetical protein [Novosphingobium sp. AP12]|uniref:hypothetical protein n=1 Tax=Novosphingobium sp. AP12 TaxID=1144305 RepID=UPI000271FB64|nr:hypothetical protein [Novosphingobium sp. AP12]EJL26230.1 hypothetical protein PMI02_03082 [Novosphingobium sp. AP12]
MSDVSIGPGSNKDQSVGKGVDAQAETEHDIEHGLAGAEAKPFANRPPTQDEDSKAAVSADNANTPAADGAANLISGRRNAGRE